MSNSELRNGNLASIVRSAWDTGRQIDLEGIGYGRIHWGNRIDLRDQPSPYYYFLAGIVRQFSISRILEIGTHWGGATRAMWRGLEIPESGRVVTVDITTESDNRLKSYPGIRKIVGDGNSEEVFEQVLTAFDQEPIDLVYIDAAHQTMPTFESFALYGMALRPKLVIFDDITLNHKMLRAWQLIQASLPENDTINAAEIIREIRPTADNPGFGIARLAHNLQQD